jgi:hypothetical protein
MEVHAYCAGLVASGIANSDHCQSAERIGVAGIDVQILEHDLAGRFEENRQKSENFKQRRAWIRPRC